MATKESNRAREVILKAVENQIRKNDPPETKETLNRLIQSGQSREESLRLIACVLANEMFEVMKSKTHYDNARYVANLARLPNLPWDEK
jgi:peroxiredoxin family protein